MNRKVFGILAAASMIATGCQDKTLEDWRRDNVDQQLSKYQAVVGTYTGTLTSVSTREAIGNIALEITSDTTVGPSSDQLSTEQRAVLHTKLTFSGNSQTVVVFDKGYFDPATNKFSTTTSLSLRGGSTVDVDVSGTFDGASLNGSIDAGGLVQNGGDFVVTRATSQDAAKLVSGAPNSRGGIGAPEIDTYSGVANYVDGSQAPRMLKVVRAQLTSQEEFLSEIYPVKIVDLVLADPTDKGVVPSVFPAAKWDSTTGSLRGHSEGNRGNDHYTLDLVCRETRVEGGLTGLSCNYISSIKGYMFNVLFRPEPAHSSNGSGN